MKYLLVFMVLIMACNEKRTIDEKLILNTNEINLKQNCKLEEVINQFVKKYPIKHQYSKPHGFFESVFFTIDIDTFLIIQRTRLLYHDDFTKSLADKVISLKYYYGISLNLKNCDRKIPYQGSYRINKKAWMHFYFYENFKLNEQFSILNKLDKTNLDDYSMMHYEEAITFTIIPFYDLYLVKKDSIIKLNKIRPEKNTKVTVW